MSNISCDDSRRRVAEYGGAVVYLEGYGQVVLVAVGGMKDVRGFVCDIEGPVDIGDQSAHNLDTEEQVEGKGPATHFGSVDQSAVDIRPEGVHNRLEVQFGIFRSGIDDNVRELLRECRAGRQKDYAEYYV